QSAALREASKKLDAPLAVFGIPAIGRERLGRLLALFAKSAATVRRTEPKGGLPLAFRAVLIAATDGDPAWRAILKAPKNKRPGSDPALGFQLSKDWVAEFSLKRRRGSFIYPESPNALWLNISENGDRTAPPSECLNKPSGMWLSWPRLDPFGVLSSASGPAD
ncbi:MAG: hypothetical protein GXP31_07810, partial [Kiritimatiellaeota bacterium]|nr:hypothetical protein [Kiritimatiellota bacterium]